MATIVYSKKSFVERVLRHLANNFPNDEFSISENEILLYTDSALAASIVGMMYNNAKITGVLDTPEAFVVTSELGTLQQNTKTLEWFATLPQPPLSLPLGHSITNVTFDNGGMIMPVKNKRVPYREFMPLPTGTRYRAEGGIIYLKSNDGGSLANETISVQMIMTRTTDLDIPMNVADDVLEVVFNLVVAKCVQRFGVPQDLIKDDLSPGNKSS